jgi:hypothetical protein
VCNLHVLQHALLLLLPSPSGSIPSAEKPSIGTFLAEWKSLYDSGSGERGLFSRAAAQKQAARSNRRDATQDFGTNPCWWVTLDCVTVCCWTVCQTVRRTICCVFSL